MAASFSKENGGSTNSVLQNSDILVIQLASMDSRFSLKLLVHGTGLLSLKLRHLLYLGPILFKIIVHPFCIRFRWNIETGSQVHMWCQPLRAVSMRIAHYLKIL